ncbi:MAG TPA: hypothetical protein VK747_11895 [Blastocatellia bacterium]|nr:hypothetical protein [Blastocatellia bacterium]
MIRNRTLCVLAMICLLVGSIMVAPARAYVGTQDADKADKPKKDKKDKDKDKDKKDKKKDDQKADKVDAGGGRAVLWEDPGDIESRDLFNGPGGADGAPDPKGKFTFIERSKSGTSEKINVDDDRGRKWQVKFGAEARPSPTASRIAWAAGYHVDTDYFVKRTHIEGRGGFDVWDVRFKRRDDGFKDIGIWSWHTNPFAGTRELQGLKVLMALLNNWDLKDVNNKIVHASKKSGGDKSEQIYYVSDLGGTLGKTGSPFRKIPFFASAPAGTKGDAGDYSDQVFITGVSNGHVVFNYKGKDPKALEGVTVENARWMGNLLGRLSDKQLSDAFRAGGFSDWEVTTYVRTVRARINELKNLK